MARLKLDLHPIYNRGERIEAELQRVVQEAETKRIEEIEIIPGKGSGALKRTVIRFLERPEIKAKIHRVVKDSDNWGRLFVYFRWPSPNERRVPSAPAENRKSMPRYPCFFCDALNPVGSAIIAEVQSGSSVVVECPACGLPNRLTRAARATREAARGGGDELDSDLQVESGY